MRDAAKYFEMKDPVRVGPVAVYSEAQQQAIGQQLASAVTEGRPFEVREGPGRSILVLVTPADDLGHVYEVKVSGTIIDIGVTEKA